MKDKEKKHLLRWFLGLMEDRLTIYLFCILISSMGTAFSKIANAWIVESVVSAAQSRNPDGLLIRILIQFLAFVSGWCLWRMGIMHYNIEGRIGTAKLEKRVFAKAMRLPNSYYEQHHSGDFISKLIYDTERASNIYSSRLRRLLAAIIGAVVYLLPMMYYSPQLTLCLLLISVATFLVNHYFAHPMKQAGKELAQNNVGMMEAMTNILSGVELVKTYAVGEKLLQSFGKENQQYFTTQKKVNRISAALSGLNNLFDLLGTLAFLGLGVWFVSRNKITLGMLSAIYTLYGPFHYAFMEIGRYFPELMNCLANVENLYDFLQLEEEPGHYITQSNYEEVAAEIEVDINNVSFGYTEGKEVLSDFHMQIARGQCVAIVGESGSGKSTLAKLLLGFYPLQKGTINICGKNGRNSTIEEMRDLIAYVPQEPYLYEVSIAENIAYGRGKKTQEVTREDIVNAAKIANAHEFIMRLPKGYDTIPGERGNTLSGGERQRIAIARAVLKNAPILLLDEATSALDNESERLVNEAINRMCRNRTTIIIAHRPSTIAMADKVVRL